MPSAHTARENLTDAIVWILETIVCAVIIAAFAGFLIGDLIGDSRWRSVFAFVSIWFLGGLCATIDVRHRRRKRREPGVRSPEPTPDQWTAPSDRPGD